MHCLVASSQKFCLHVFMAPPQVLAPPETQLPWPSQASLIVQKRPSSQAVALSLNLLTQALAVSSQTDCAQPFLTAEPSQALGPPPMQLPVPLQ